MSSRWLALIVAGVIFVGAGLWIWRDRHERSDKAADTTDVVQDDSGRRVLYWYDPMVPQQRFDRPGKSPFMDMQLVPKYANEASDTGVRISPTVQQNLGIRLAKAERTRVGDRLSAVGRIEADERRRYALPSRVAGFVEKLQVRAVGDRIAAGEKVAEIYSPELLAAQQEFLALMRAAELSNTSSLVDAARRRLVLFGMAEREIESIASSGQAQRRFGVYSPVSGFVTELEVREGAQIEAGATLMSIADLSSLWLIAEIPERDANRIRTGAAAVARLEGAPEQEFSGTVDYVYPVLNAQTRTTRVRIVLPNENGALRPGMFAQVSLGTSEREVLSIPTEAVIYTGSRAVVIVKDEQSFRPVEVRTGAEANGRTEILAGLNAGEDVVASGQFLIDSEASLAGVLTRLSSDANPRAEPLREPESEAPPTNDTTSTIKSRGRVVSVDHAGGTATLAHEPIPELDWPSMTMGFRFADPHIVHSLSVGDIVRFTMRAQPENGSYVIESVTHEEAR